jgi:tripartite-type tricarboxylate transporter receptor subunit TctC
MLRRALLAAGGSALAWPGTGQAQAPFPDRPVRIVVPFPPGGATDIIARFVAERLQARWRQPVVIENRPGAGTVLGTQMVARAAPDGTTLGFVISAHTINPALRRDLPYDTLRDFAAITQVARAHVVLLASNDLPAQTLREVVALSRQRAGGLSVATPGVGTVMHMIMELLAVESGAELVHVPYQGGAAALADVTSGRAAAAGPLALGAPAGGGRAAARDRHLKPGADPGLRTHPPHEPGPSRYQRLFGDRPRRARRHAARQHPLRMQIQLPVALTLW